MAPTITLLRQAVLKHGPVRHGLMLQPNPQAKYREYTSAPTEKQLQQHLAGTITVATPAVSNDLAACIIFDIDDYAVDTIPAVLETARQRQLWAWGEWHPATNRGYVWIPFDHLIRAAALARLGHELVAATTLTPEQRDEIDNRTANNAITRLPFGRHTHTKQRGELIFQDGTSAVLDADPEAALSLWERRYQENPADQVAPITRIAPALVPQQRARRQLPNSVSAPEVQQRWNAAYDVSTILLSKGGQQATRTSWHCPCGQHRNGDRTPSLLIRPAKNARYGSSIVQGYSPTCAFHGGPKDVFDAFNVYRILHGLSNAEMLQHARQELNLATPEGAPATQHTKTSRDNHQAPQPSAPSGEPPASNPPQPTVSAAAVLTRAGSDCSLSRAMRSVLDTVVSLIGSRPATQITMRTLETATGLARRTIQIAQRRLEAAGYLAITPTSKRCGGHDANRYALCMERGRSPRSPLKLIAWKGGEACPAPAAPEPPAVIERVPAPAAPPVTIDDAVEPAPRLDIPPFHASQVRETTDLDWQEDQGVHCIFPQKVPLENICADTSTEDDPGATFDPVGYAAWAATLDPTTERPWTYGRSPREVMQGHEYGMAELLRSQAERGPLQPSSVEPVADPPVRRLHQTALTLPTPAVTADAVPGLQALRMELTRIEREARRYFAQKAPNAGRQAQIRAAALRRQLAALEKSPSVRPEDAAANTAARGQTPPYMPFLRDSSGDFGAVAVGDIDAGVAQLQGEDFAGSGLSETIGGDGAAQELLGVGSAKGVHDEAGSGRDAEAVTGSGDLALGDAGEAARVGEDVVTVAGNGGENAGIKQAGDQALAATLGVAPGDLDCFIFKIDVLDAQPGQLVDAEAAAEGELGGELHLARELANNGLRVGLGEAEAWGRARRAGAERGNEGGFVAPPAALAHPGLQLVQSGDGGAEAAAGELAVFAGLDVGLPVGVSDGTQLLQPASVALLLDPAHGSDDASLVGAKALVAENNAGSGAVQLGFMTTGAGLENPVKGVRYLLDQRAGWHGLSPPGAV